ncbi:MAG: DUF262 domain-containing HNH endonuclease family protein [Burkholderiaceae bacterium]|nr:DUF262 domain-containing HNH endonuclease family protein [Burkholderiaceae bacterium]
MKTELLTVSKIFHEAIFRIPDYQRGYSWEEPHLKDFWADLEQLDSKKSHYTGVLTLEEVPESAWSRWEDDVWIIRSKKYHPYYVVDGQQRLTTISILLQCLLEKTEAEELNYTPIEIHRRKYIFETRSDSLARAYIFGYEKDNPSREFLKQEIFSDTSNGHSTGEATIYTRNLRNAKKFFLEKIAKLSHIELEELFSKITQQLVFNAYEISKEIDVFVAFETMNNRGKPLSALELLKNRLIYLVANVPEAHPGDGKMLRKQINDAWAIVYHNLGRNEERPLSDELFLQTHLVNYYHQKVSKEVPTDDDQQAKFMHLSYAVLEEPSHFLLRMHFTRRRLLPSDSEEAITAAILQEYAADLRSTAETYFKISTPSNSGYSDAEKIYLERLGRLRGYDASPVVLAVYRRESNQKLRAQFLESFERYIFCISLKGGYRHTQRSTLMSADLVRYIKGTRKIEELITLYNNSVDQIFKEESLSDTLHDWIKNGPGYYGWRSIRYFLFEYELSLKTRSRSDRSKIDWSIFSKEEYQTDYISVEHIYPQRARAQYWTERFGKLSSTEKRRYRNSLGNLLALSTPKNASLSNKPFPEKVESTGSTVGYRFGSYSENEVALEKDWSPAEIMERGIRMLSFMETHWRLSIGDRNQKLKALGFKNTAT